MKIYKLNGWELIRDITEGKIKKRNKNICTVRK